MGHDNKIPIDDPTRKASIISLYTVSHLSADAIGKLYDVSGRHVNRLMARWGVPTTAGEWVDVTCYQCGKEHKKARAQWRKHVRHFCSDDCYFKARKNGYARPGELRPYVRSSYGTKLARATVKRFFNLQRGQVVHHHDRDNLNNAPDNLAVFASQADHMRYHHGDDVAMLWDGRRAETHA